MFIKKINDYDIEAREADIIISDGEYEILCYAQPFINKNAKFTLCAFEADNIIRSSEYNSFVKKTDDGFYSYRLQGKVVNRKKRLVAIGKIVIEINDNIPGDIEENEIIAFSTTRIDYIES